MTYEIQRWAAPVFGKPAAETPRQISGSHGFLDAVSRVFPSNFPIGILRSQGTTTREIADVLEMEGEIYVVVPGSDQPYSARKVRVSWVTPLDVEVLGIESKKDEKCTDLKLGRIKVQEYHPQATSDPNITIYTENGELHLNQVLGIPQFYVKNCRVTYTGNRRV